MTRILVTNDDGVEAEGLLQLAAALEGVADEVIVVAPDSEQSASGHALTLHRPLRMRELRAGVYSVDGTPTDCVNLAVLWLLTDTPPDLVVSGINYGLNLGDDVTYSGTVSAAFEGVLLGIPAIAFSQDVRPGFSFERSAAFAGRFVEAVLAGPRTPDTLFNVNLPAPEVEGIEFTKLGKRVYQQVVAEKMDPRGRRYFWIAGTPEWQDEEGSDHNAVQARKASVTPLHLDLTDYARLDPGDELRIRLSEIV